jgi:hypothetical protein
MKREIEGGIDLIVRQVSAIVQETADVIAEQNTSKSSLEWEAIFFETLAVNCNTKAQMARAFVADFRNTQLKKAEDRIAEHEKEKPQ